MKKLFNCISYFWINVVETLLRLFPFPAKTGIAKMGSPNRTSPVLLTCNFQLTVRRVKHALKGIDCYLLVANTKGINVWCAATGGHLNNHSVISVIKTSGIEEKVDHKKIILPQLAAPGVESKVIEKKTSWEVLWGPVDIKDIKEFLENNFDKSEKMHKVTFPLIKRIEMAIMWAFPLSVFLSLIWIPFFIDELLALWIQVWVISLITFIFYPIFEPMLLLEKRQKKHAFFGWSKVLILIFISGFALLGTVIYTIILNSFEPWLFARWCIFSLIVSIIIVIDLTGTTPIFKSDTHGDKVFTIKVDSKKCKGTEICLSVCPRNCFEMNEERNLTIFKREHDCVQCSACIVQCPFDAIQFEDQKGNILTPEIVRKFKLNLSGKRTIRGNQS